MGSFRKWLLWGVLLAPVAILSGGVLFAKIWLNKHLNREMVWGETHIQMTHPHLGWRLNFTADSLEVRTPKFNIKAGTFHIDTRVWQGIVSLSPTMDFGAQCIQVFLATDTSSDVEMGIKGKRHRTRTFSGVRIPISLQARVGQVEVWRDSSLFAKVIGARAFTQGPKGAAVECDSLVLAIPADSGQIKSVFAMGGSYRISARWFGKSLKYQVRMQNLIGDYLRMEGSHRKLDLERGMDSIDLAIGDLSPYNRLFSKPFLPSLTGINVQAGIVRDSQFAVRSHFKMTTPSKAILGQEHVKANLDILDSSGSLGIEAHGDSGESVTLHGRFAFPIQSSAPSQVASQVASQKDFRAWIQRFSGSFTGFTHGVRIQLGGKVLPGDVEIQRLNFHSGLHADADIRSKDGSAVSIKFNPGSILSDTSSPAWRVAKFKKFEPWTLKFDGQASPSETWVHAWTDTNISYHTAKLNGVFQNGEWVGEAWINQARAYGAVADSLYTKQTIGRDGYRLLDSRLYWKDAVWPVTGQVDWGKLKNRRGSSRQVSLHFRTQHKQFGTLTYSMPARHRMEVNASDVVIDKLPYPKIGKIMALKPVLSGSFAWDWAARSGTAVINSAVRYNGENLNLKMEGAWNWNRFSLKQAEIQFAGSKIKVSGDVRLHGRQFYQMQHLKIHDVEGLALETDRFDAARLAVFLGPGYPVDGGMLNGRLSYTDSTGFLGSYTANDLEIKPIKKLLHIKKMTLVGDGDNILLSMRTAAAPEVPWFNDSLSIKVDGCLGRVQNISLKAISENGLHVKFDGRAQEFRDLDGNLKVSGQSILPGQGGTIQALRLEGHVAFPFSHELLQKLEVDSGFIQGRYAVPGLDTQSIAGSLSINSGHLIIPDLEARNARSVALTGQAECDFQGPFKLSAHLRGENLKIKWPDLQKLVLQNSEVSLHIDSLGLSANATIGKAEFQSQHAPINIQGTLENLSLAYHLPPPSRKGAAAPPPIAQLKVKTALRGFLFQHKLGFRDVQRFFRNVKVDKRNQHHNPIDLQISVETAGSTNRIETDILRMFFKGDLEVHGIYPYTLLTGQFSALSGELGQSSQSYDITDFDLKWQNATVEEGRVSVEGGKRLRYDCKPDTKRTCNVYIKLDGRLDEMAFTYDSDCGGNSGNVIEPAALINSVSRGCYSDQYVAGAGGGNYGEAVVNFLEPAINEKLSSVGNRYSLGWIKSTQVSGIGTVMSADSTGSEPIAIGIESKEKWGMSFKAKAGYHPEKKLANPWESRVALEWRPPLERVAHSSEWKRRVRDRVMLEASAENRPEEHIGETEKNQVRKQVGISYHYKFWDLW